MAELLQQQQVSTVLRLWKTIPTGTANSIFCQMNMEYSIQLLSLVQTHLAAAFSCCTRFWAI
jgi:hypothetical protein